MLLAAVYVFRPVARMRPFVVEQTADAQLLGCGAIPTGPVTGTGRFVAEYAVQPVAVFRADWSV